MLVYTPVKSLVTRGLPRNRDCPAMAQCRVKDTRGMALCEGPGTHSKPKYDRLKVMGLAKDKKINNNQRRKVV